MCLKVLYDYKFWFEVILYVDKLLLYYVVCKCWLGFKFGFGLDEYVCLRKGKLCKGSCGNGGSWNFV